MSSFTGNRLVPILDSSNYHTWKTKMEMLLIHEGLWGIVSERRTAPAAAGLLEKWQDDSEKATATIFLHLGDRAERHIRALRDPVQIWKRLKEVYEPRGFSARFYLWQKLFTTRMADHQTQGAKATESYIDSCRSLCEQLRGSGAEVSDEIEASALLAGLDESYESFVATATQSFCSNGNGNSGTNVEDLISRIMDEDRRHTSRNGDTTHLYESRTLIARAKRVRYECDHCHRTGHIAKKCWDLHPELRPTSARAAYGYSRSYSEDEDSFLSPPP